MTTKNNKKKTPTKEKVSKATTAKTKTARKVSKDSSPKETAAAKVRTGRKAGKAGGRTANRRVDKEGSVYYFEKKGL